MAQTVVDLSQASKRVVPKLEHDLIIGDTTRPVGERAGVASLEAVKEIIGGGGVTVSSLCTEQPISGKPLVGHER